MDTEILWIFDPEKHPPLGHGGTKSFHEVDTNTAVAIPNIIDGQILVQIWPRIIEEEIKMSNLLANLNIPSQKLKKCQIKHDGQIFSSYSAPTFQSYVKDGLYIIDTKNTKSSQWPKDHSLSLLPTGCDPFDVNAWVKVLETAKQDVLKLAKNRVYLSSDSLNLAFVNRNSYWHSGADRPYEVRVFGFDFSSKYRSLDFDNQKELTEQATRSMMRRVIEFTLWEEMSPKAFALNKKQYELIDTLLNNLMPSQSTRK